ncbi:hypothetical protein DM860_003791 [Cuscuta australis]|uniref:Pectin acetylesterase n=1 Tax=Cuscuta australis TaxID=267555 RepID=A0A328DH04_9ASTE|nr:hypothetical protein DM860_003791 [Cuscuta australis]
MSNVNTDIRRSVKADNSTLVNPTFLRDKKAVCLTGNRAAYYFLPGSGDALNNWLVFIPSGGWCENFTSCVEYNLSHGTGTPSHPSPADIFSGILSSQKLENPDFYNWNRIYVRYCDGSSFTGNSKKFQNDTMLYFRGARIFKAVTKELLEKGMGSATNRSSKALPRSCTQELSPALVRVY